MAIFKYTVANKEGKKLSGSVEAPDEQTARGELNNLGFSILSLQETDEQPQIDPNAIRFIFEAIDKNSKIVTGTIPAKDEKEAFEKLKSEYNLTVSAIWAEGAKIEQIEQAKKTGTQNLQAQIKMEGKQPKAEELAVQKRDEFVKAKIENILKDVHELLRNFEQELTPPQKTEINKRIDKLLRIKNSTNIDYILATAQDLLKFIKDQEKSLSEKAHEDKKFQFKLKTQKLLDELNKEQQAKSLSDDIVGKIEDWQSDHVIPGKEPSTFTKFINRILNAIKNFFITPPEIKAIKEEIKVYNRQIWEFIKLYFKEPTPEYKIKVKDSIKTIWNKRKQAKARLKQIKKELKEKRKANEINEAFTTSFLGELNALTGWLLALYIIYYFVSLYLKTKNFGLSEIPKGFIVYESHIFKYILITLFLLHTTTAIKINFFKKNLIADMILFPVFIFATIISILNF